MNVVHHAVLLLLLACWTRLSEGFAIAPSVISNSWEKSKFLIVQKHTICCGSLPKVWVEDAEDDFVDEEENLEEEEVCLKSLKAFCSSDNDDPLFLCAGALVQRPESKVCDAWTADSLLASPNLQLQGATKILDQLFLFHLRQHEDDSLCGLRYFVLRCAEEQETAFASHKASQLRGFRPLQENMLRADSIYTSHCYDHDWEGAMVFDYWLGKQRYKEQAAVFLEEQNEGEPFYTEQQTILEILDLLPDADTIQRHTIKRYQVGRLDKNFD